MESVVLPVATAAESGRGVHESSRTEVDEGFPAPGRTGGKSQPWKPPGFKSGTKCGTKPGRSPKTLGITGKWKCPRQDSNLRACLRRAPLYPLSYGGQECDDPISGGGDVRIRVGPARTARIRVRAAPTCADRLPS